MLLLNYNPVLHQPTGIGVYANGVLPTFNQFEHILIPGGGSGGVTERLKRLAWSQFQLPRLARESKADLIFTPAPEGYLGEQVVPQVVMVHDLRPLSHPELSMQSLYFRSWVPPLLSQCAHIIVNSNFTASEVCRLVGVSTGKISVIPLACDVNHFCMSEIKHRPHHRPYFLHIGQAYPHKNLERLIRSFHAISHRFPDVDLLLLGKPHPSESRRLQRLTSELGLFSRVIFKRYVPYGDLPNWYRGALAFVYPSLWEGFGLPVLEAMACGCPVITSQGTVMEEIASDAALFVDPLSLSSIKTALETIIKSQSTTLLDDLSQKGLYRAHLFSWKSTCQATAHRIRKILDDIC